MAIGPLGSASYIIQADLSQFDPGIQKAEKELQDLGVQVTKVGKLFQASFSQAVTAAGRLVPTLDSALRQLDQMGEKVTKAMAGLEGGGGGPTLALPEGMEEFERKAIELTSNDPFAFLLRSGVKFNDALQLVINRFEQLKKQERDLISLQKTFQENFRGAGATQTLDLISVELADIQSRMEKLTGVSSGDKLFGLIGTGAKKATVDLQALQRQLVLISQPATIQAFPAIAGLPAQINAATKAAKDFVDTFTKGAQKAAEEVQKITKAPTATSGLGQQRAAFPGAVGIEKQIAEQMAIARQRMVETETAAKKLSTTVLGQAQAWDKDERELQQLIGIQKKYGASIPGVTAEIEKLRRKLAEANLEVNKHGRIMGQLGQTGRVSGFLRNLSGAFDRFGQSIEEATGIAESDFAILLGAGLAGGFAGVLRIVEKLTRALIEFATAQSFLAEQMRLSFGSATSEVNSFAENTVRGLGVSEQEARETAIAFAELARQTRLTGDTAVNFAKSMTVATAAIESSFPGFKTTEEAAQAVTAAIKGSEDALLNLGITITDLNEIAKENFGGRLIGQLTQVEQEFVRSVAVTEAAREGLDKFGAGTETVSDRLRDVKSDIADFFGAINRGTVLEDPFQAASSALEGLIQQADIPLLERLFVGGNFLEEFATAIDGLTSEQLAALRKSAEANIEDKDTRKEVLDLIDEQEKKLAEQKKILDGITASLEDQGRKHKENLETFRGSIDLQREAGDLLRQQAREQFDSLRRLEDAEERLSRTRIDNAKKLRDLNIQNTRSIEDAVTRVEAAELELLDNQNDAADRIEDAQDRIADAKKQLEREIRGINERISDLELDHRRKVEDAQQKIRKAHKDTAKAILDATLAIEDALRRRDFAAFNEAQRQLVAIDRTESVAEAEKDLARDSADFERDLARLERDRKEARLDGIEEIKRADRDLKRAERDNTVLIAKAQLQLNQAVREEVRAREDAIRSLNDLEVEQNRALRDAKRALEEAQIARERALADAGRAIERLTEKIGLQIEEIKKELRILFRANNPGVPVPEYLKRQWGGPVQSGVPYLVGEGGPELFVPNRNGQIVSNRDLLKAINNNNAQQNVTVITNREDPDVVAFKVASRLVRGVG